MSATHLLIVVDSDIASRHRLKTVAQERSWNVVEFDSAESYLQYGSSHSPGCFVLEQQLPRMNGLELQHIIHDSLGAVPVIFTVNNGTIPFAVKAMQQGALTVLEKPISEPQFAAALDLALTKLVEHVQTNGELRQVKERFAKLTDDERRVLGFVLQGTSNRNIAITLEMGLRTVELRRSNIMKKTEANSVSELVRLAIMIGFPNDRPQ